MSYRLLAIFVTVAMLLVGGCGGGGSSSASTPTNAPSGGAPPPSDSDTEQPAPANEPPVARATAPGSAPDTSEAIELDGSASGDPEGGQLAFSWQQLAGPSVVLTGGTSPLARFEPPDVGADTTLEFGLTVTDEEGLSATASVTLVVEAVVPVQAVLGPIVGATVEVFDAMHLDGAPLFSAMTHDAANLADAGVVLVPQRLIAPDGLYVIRVRGGEDVDADDDGVRDAFPSPLAGSVRAVLAGADFETARLRVNALTELAYELVEHAFLAGEAPDDILEIVDLAASRVLSADLDENGVIDRRDLLAFRPGPDAGAYAGGVDGLRRMESLVRSGLLRLDDAEAATEPGTIVFRVDPGVTDFVVRGDRAYVQGAENAIRILDISAPGAPVELGALPRQPETRAIDVSGSIAVVARSAAIDVVDLQDESAPEIVATLEGFTSLRDVAIDGDVAVLADASEVLLVDLSRPATPVIVGRLPGAVNREVDARDGLAVLLAGDVVRIVDISTPSAPLQLAGPEFFGVRSAALDGDRLYLVGSFVAVVDVSDPTAPELLGRAPSAESFSALSVRGEFLAASASGRGVYVYRVADPSAPALVGRFDLNASAVGVAILEGGLLAASGVALRLLEFGDFDPPRAVAALAEISPRSLASTEGRLAYIASGGRFGIVDMLDPLSPSLVAEVERGGTLLDFAWDGEVAILGASDGGGLMLLDTTREGFPELSRIGSVGDVTAVVLEENLAFVVLEAFAGSDLRVYDVSAPDRPNLLGVVSLGADPVDALAVRGRLAVVASRQGVAIVDASDPTAPRLAGSTEVVGSTDIEFVSETLAYVARRGTLFLLDVGHPESPTTMAVDELRSEMVALAVDGSLGVAALGRGGLAFLDTSESSLPVQRSVVRVEHAAFDVERFGDFAAVASDGSGLRVYRAPRRASLPFD